MTMSDIWGRCSEAGSTAVCWHREWAEYERSVRHSRGTWMWHSCSVAEIR